MLMRFLLTISFVIPASAVEKVSWQDCLDQVLRQNPEILSVHDQLQALKDQVKASYGGYYPQLSLNLGYSQTSSNSLGETSRDDQYSTALTATQNIFNGFQDQNKVVQSQINQRISEISLVTLQARIRNDLAVAFEGLVYAEEFLKMTQQTIKRREENLRLVSLRFESGRENKGSVLLSQANLEFAKYDELQAQHAFEVAQTQLMKVLGRSSEEPLLKRSGVIPSETPPPSPDFQELAQKTPQYQTALAQETLSQTNLEIAKGAFYPSFDLSGSVEKIGPQLPLSTDRWSVGAKISFPLFSGFKDHYLVQNARAQTIASTRNLHTVSLQVITALKQNYVTWIEAFEKQKVDSTFVKAAQVRAEIARKKYNNGLQTFEEWDLIENDLITREKNFLASQRDLILAEAAWLQTQGRDLK